MPLCNFVQTDPNDAVVGTVKAILQGSGRWTTEPQNRMQRSDRFVGRQGQEVAMSIGYGLLNTGDCAVVSKPGKTKGDGCSFNRNVRSLR